MDALQKPPALGALVLTEEELAAQKEQQEQVQLGPLALGLLPNTVGPLVGDPAHPGENEQTPARLRASEPSVDGDADDDEDDEDDEDEDEGDIEEVS
jgi:hypothetical protein